MKEPGKRLTQRTPSVEERATRASSTQKKKGRERLREDEGKKNLGEHIEGRDPPNQRATQYKTIMKKKKIPR